METNLPRVSAAVCQGMMDTLSLDLVEPAAKDPDFKPDETMMAEVQEHLRNCPGCRQTVALGISKLNQKLQLMVEDSNILKNVREAYQEVLAKVNAAE